MDIFLTVISLLLMAFLGIHVWATFLIGREARDSAYKFPALNERFVTGIIQTTSAFGLASLGANRIFDFHWSEEAVLTILSTSLLVKVIPSIVWLYLYYTNGFHQDGSIKDK